MDVTKLPIWEMLQKKMTWEQLDFIHDQKVLDFGSVNGWTASHMAIDNKVIAIEPNQEMLVHRNKVNQYEQICGGIEELKKLESNSFDVVLCHNVLEYVDKQEAVVQEFARVLKPGGILSIVKHNRFGRVMQMAVLLNNFNHANELLDGKNGESKQFGSIQYYNDKDLVQWAKKLSIHKIFGIRTFWDLQQNQEIQKEETWQEQMLRLERKVSTIEEFKQVAFLHHVILVKESEEGRTAKKNITYKRVKCMKESSGTIEFDS